jgi:hypothetical protein
VSERDRELIVRLLAISALCVPSTAGQTLSVDQNHSEVFRKSGVLVQPLNPASTAALQSLGLSPQSEKALSEILPLCFRLQNNSSRAIVQITVRYSMLPHGNESRPAHGTLQSSMLDKVSRHGWIEPAHQLLISPSSSLNLHLSGGSASVDSIRKEVLAQRAQFSAERFRRVEVSLDSIAFEDGEVIGPDFFNVIAQQSESVKARCDLADDVAGRLDDLPALQLWLQAKAAEYRGVDSDTGLPDFYRLAQSGFAQGLLVAMKSLPPAEFVERMRSTQPAESGIRLHKAR